MGGINEMRVLCVWVLGKKNKTLSMEKQTGLNRNTDHNHSNTAEKAEL